MQKPIALLSVALLLATAVCCAAEEAPTLRRRVAVLAFENLRKDPNTDWVGAVTADTLTTKLAGLKAMIVIERQQVNKVIQENRFQESDLVNPQTAVKAGRILGAQSVVVGSFAVSKEQVVLNARIVDVETAEVLNAAALRGNESQAMDLPFQLADAVIESLSKKVVVADGKPRVESATPVAVTEAERKKLAERPTQNTEAYQAYGRGVDLLKKHRWKEAQYEFQKATELDPAFASAWRGLGFVQGNQGAWPKALECYAKAEVLFQAKQDEKNLAGALNNIGEVHGKQGRYAEAMKYYEQSLVIGRKTGDQPGVALTLNNIGNVLVSQGRYLEAMRYFEESLAIGRRLGDEPAVAGTLKNIGNVHHSQGGYGEAMKCYEESLAISRTLGDEPGVAMTLCNIGTVLGSQARYLEAMRSYEESLAISRRLGDEPDVARTLFNMAFLYWKTTNECHKALPLAREAAEIAHKSGFPDVADYDKLVSDLEKALGR
jgi:tetratricopeptide (TPR) repeat protein